MVARVLEMTWHGSNMSWHIDGRLKNSHYWIKVVCGFSLEYLHEECLYVIAIVSGLISGLVEFIKQEFLDSYWLICDIRDCYMYAHILSCSDCIIIKCDVSNRQLMHKLL